MLVCVGACVAGKRLEKDFRMPGKKKFNPNRQIIQSVKQLIRLCEDPIDVTCYYAYIIDLTTVTQSLHIYIYIYIYLPVTKGHTKNGTMH